MIGSEITLKLVHSFPQSFINGGLEFIAHKKANEYFRLEDCETEFDVKCKVLEYFSRGAYKTAPFEDHYKNEEFHKFMLNGINKYLGTNFSQDDMEIIYTYLGNRCNHLKTEKFIKSGYDMSVLQNKPKYFSKTHEEYIEHTSRCASCIHSKGIEKGYVYCYNSYKNNYPYAIDNSVDCNEFKERKGGV